MYIHTHKIKQFLMFSIYPRKLFFCLNVKQKYKILKELNREIIQDCSDDDLLSEKRGFFECKMTFLRKIS